MPSSTLDDRYKLLSQAQHLRDIAIDQIDPRVRGAALELAEEYEQQAAKLEQQDRD